MSEEGAGMNLERLEPDPETRRWNIAIDWLLNSRHCADPDIQEPFWAYVDGYITREELDMFTVTEAVQARNRRKPREDR